jgi:Holliday junction resolvase RusA-like endonuclease
MSVFWDPEDARNSAPSSESALFMLTREAHRVKTIATFTIDGEPASKARARFTKQGSKNHAYTPEKTRAAEEKIGWLFRKAAPGHKPDGENAYGVFAIFFHGTRRRRDVDNMIKLVCDGLNKIAWRDDAQVEEVSGRRGYDDPKNARTEVWVYQIGPLDEGLTVTCSRCGKSIRSFESWKGMRKYCSQSCHYADRQAAPRRTAECLNCGAEFTDPKVNGEQKYCSRKCAYEAKKISLTCVVCGNVFRRAQCFGRPSSPTCSPECRAAYWREHRKVAAKGTCSVCGGPTSKKTYKRCAACFSARGSAEVAS